MPEPEALTVLLQQAHAGDPGAADRAYATLYPELLKIARARLRVNQAPTLLDTQALVHESFLRFVGGAPVELQSRKHFYAYAAKAMRHIVIDGLQQVTFDTGVFNALPQHAGTPVLDVERALAALEAVDAPLAELVELRFYGGYTDAEAALALGISERTVRRQWDKARAFLLVELQPD
jgi:RNA polymerase sigma factor (TIGR02999 family)